MSISMPWKSKEYEMKRMKFLKEAIAIYGILPKGVTKLKKRVF